MQPDVRYCAGCGTVLGWIGLRKGSVYCCEGCRHGACTCGREAHPSPQAEHDDRRDVSRLA